jgi:hypothetical protein
MLRGMLALLLLLASGATAPAQRADPAEGACFLPRGAEKTLAEWVRSNPMDGLIILSPKQTSHARATLSFEIRKPEGIEEEVWRRTAFAAIAYRAAMRQRPPDDAQVFLGYVMPPSPGADVTPIRAEFTLPDRYWPTAWQVAIIGCQDSMPERFGLTEVTVSSYSISVAAGLGSVIFLYVLIAFTARGVHARQLELVAQEAASNERRPKPALLRAFSPVIICQDAFGAASLSRFQVLLFTLAVVGVYAYVLVRTGQLSALSEDVLVLLGITLTGSTLANVADGQVLSAPNRLWLLATGVLDNRPRRPRWQDLLSAEGEIDVTRVQALAFSAFAALALVWYGATDLEQFRIPPQLNALIGISQIVYVAGKALPREAAKRLNEEVRLLREAERDTLAEPEDPSARLAFDRARTALQTSLYDVFGERFRPERLRSLVPGQASIAAAVPAA